MGQTVGELFVSLGIKNGDKSISVLTQVQGGVKNVASTSLEAKAAIIGLFYAIDKLTQASANHGANIQNWSTLLGIDQKAVQQWQHAAIEANVSSDELLGTLEKIQDIGFKIKNNEGVPQHLLRAFQSIGVNQKTVEDMIRDPGKILFDILARAREAVKSGKLMTGEVRNLIDFLGSQNVIRAGIAGQLTPDKLLGGPIRSDKQVAALADMKRGMNEVNEMVDKDIDDFAAKFGPVLIKGLKEIVPQINAVVTEFSKLLTDLKTTGTLKDFFKDFAEILKTVRDLIKEIRNEKEPEKPEDKKKFIEKKIIEKDKQIEEGKQKGGIAGWVEQTLGELGKKSLEYYLKTPEPGATPPDEDIFKDLMRGNEIIDLLLEHTGVKSIATPPVTVPQNNQGNNYNFNQPINIHGDVKEPSKVADVIRREVVNGIVQVNRNIVT